MDLHRLATQHLEEFVSIRRQLHQHPELSFQEESTTKLIRHTLKKYGIPIEEIPMKTGVCALIQGNSARDTIVLREDIDALPMQEATGLPFASQVEGVSHACGHDIHTAALLMAGVMLYEMRDALQCNVRLVFQPAEEVLTGAKTMLDQGVRELKPKGDLVVVFHVCPDYPAGSIAVTKGPAEASSDLVRIAIKGKGGHGAYPHRAIDPIVVSSYLISQLQSIISRENNPFLPAVLSFGSIHGGTASNVIPDVVRLEGTLRAFDEDNRHQMSESIVRIAEGCGHALRAEILAEVIPGVPVVINDHHITDAIVGSAEKVLGTNNIHKKAPSPGSDDFSFFLQEMPGSQFFVGTSNADPNSKIGLHNVKVVFDESAICTGAIVMSQFVLDYQALGDSFSHTI